ncbi:MAG: DUF3857 domain-containing protein [Chitinophagaceae bacterium]
MKYKLLLILCFFFQLSHAQLLTIEWSNDPKLHTIENKEFMKESAIIVLEDVQYEIEVSAKGATSTRRIHRIVRVNDEKGIESFNKMQIGYSEKYPIKSLKARTITPSGKAIELKPEAFKETKDENNRLNKVFAYEGVERGSEIEYILELEQPINEYGSYTLQENIPTVQNRFEFITPKELIYELKGYNNAKVDKDTILKEKRHILAHTENLDAVNEEKYASYYPHFARVEYSLAYNLYRSNNQIRVSTWDDLSKNIHTYYNKYSDKELKEAKKILDHKDYKKITNNFERIQWIENYVKTNFVQQDFVNTEDPADIAFILKNKITNQTGFKKLLGLLLTAAEIPFEIGYTINKFQKPFDYDFYNPDNLDNCYFYFPSEKKYLAPNEIFYRSPYIPSTWRGNDAMHISVLSLGDVKTAKATKKSIPELNSSQNFHNHDVEVHFNNDMDTAIIQIKNSFLGQNAVDILPALVLLENEKKEDAAKEIIRISEKDERIDNFVYENADFESMMKEKPTSIAATIHASDIIEKAGNKYLFKIGELIGRQAEMYQEKERKYDMDIPNPHQYTRKLKIHIPNGYTVNNADKLNMDVSSSSNGKESCKFTSSYTIHDNILEVTCFEIYHVSHSPISEYETYKKVINAAADFNKIVIVLEKN